MGAQKIYQQRDFSGGLVTSMDESLLDSTMSPALSNIDVTDSLSISRRTGYAAVTAAPVVAGKSIAALHRYYKKDGSKYWMSVCGSAMLAMADAGYVTSRKELTTSNVTATSPSNISDASYSGGSAVTAAGVITATLPACNRLVVGVPSLSASVKVDSGAWVSASQATYTPTLAATPATHTVYVKTKRRVYTTTPGAAMSFADYTVEATVAASWTSNSYTQLMGHKSANGSYNLDIGSTYIAVGVNGPRGGGGGGNLPRVMYGPSAGDRVGISFLGTKVRVLFNDVVVASGETSTFPLDAFGVVEAELAVAGTVDSYSYGGYLTGFQVTAPIPAPAFDYIDYGQVGSWVREDSTLTASPTSYGFATLNDKAYYATAYNHTHGFDGSTSAVTASGSATGGFVREHKRRLFCAGKSDDSALLNYTALDNGSNWTGGGSIYLAGKDSGGECTGMAVWNNLLWYFSPSRTYSLDTTGVDTAWVARTVSQSHGCIAPQSLVAAPNSLVFLAADGVRAYGYLTGINSADGSGFMLLSENITPTLDAFTAAQRTAASGAYYRNKYWLAIGGKVFVCDLEKRTKNGQPVWTQYDYASPLVITCLTVTRGDEYGLFAGSSDGQIYRLDTGLTDGGAAIDLMYETPPIAVGSYVTTKHFRAIDLAADGNNATQAITVTPSSDDLDGTTQTVVVDAASAIRPVHAQINARGRSLKLRITSPGVAQPLSISELTVRYTPPRMR